jgi:polypeptide N-acetylgalactosaminyltransferase
MKEVAPDLVLKYPPVDPPDFASGAIQSVVNPTFCVDTMNSGEKSRIGLYHCAMDLKNPQLTQFFELSWQRDIRMKYSDMCWDVSEAGNAPVVMFGCHGMQGNQLWKFDHRMQHLIHVHSNRCLEANLDDKSVHVAKCLRSNENQKWIFAITNTTALDDWENSGAKLIS